jgi:hypothetical protein
MSRTGKDIQSRVDIAIMEMTTTTAYPLPYSKVCDTVRPRVGKASTTRTDLGGKALVDFLIPRAMLNSLVREHCTEVRPRSIKNGLGHVGFGQACGVDIANRNIVKVPHDSVREFVQEVLAATVDLGVNLGDSAFLARSLRLAQSVLKRPVPVGILNFLACRKRSELFQPQINADKALERSQGGIAKLDCDIQEPTSASVTAEVRRVRDLALRQLARVEHPESIARKPKRIALTFEVTAFQGNPCERLPAAIAQVWPTTLISRLRVLLTYGVNRPRMQSKFVGTPCGQAIQVEPARPTLIPLECVLLALVAIVPNVVHSAALIVEQSAQRLDSITVDQNHCINIQEYCSDIQSKGGASLAIAWGLG